jgi:hypothetical protein
MRNEKGYTVPEVMGIVLYLITVNPALAWAIYMYGHNQGWW